MDFVKKFFENIYLFVVDTIRDFCAGLVLLTRHPILGPHIMLRRQRRDQRNGIDPSLFLFLAALCVLVALFADFGGNVSLVVRFLGQSQADLSDADIVHLASAGKPNQRLNQLIVAGFVMALLTGALIGAVTALRRVEFRTRRSRMIRLRNLTRAETVRLPAATYAAVPALVLGFVTLLLIAQESWVTRAYLFLAGLLDRPFGYARLFDIGGLPFTSFDVALILTAGLFLLPSALPLARILCWPSLPLRRRPRALAWLGAAYGIALLMLVPLVAGVATFIWLTLATKPESEPQVTLSDLVCDVSDRPRIRLATYYTNSTDTPILFARDAFSLDISAIARADDAGEDAPITAHFSLDAHAIATVRSVGSLRDLHSYSLDPSGSGLITLTASAPRRPPDIAEGESWQGNCDLFPRFEKLHDPAETVPTLATGHFQDFRPGN